jgi:hypothetical protein
MCLCEGDGDGDETYPATLRLDQSLFEKVKPKSLTLYRLTGAMLEGIWAERLDLNVR